MKLHLLSDLHNELDVFKPTNIEADVIILAGDIDIKGRAINWAKQHFPDKPVLYVLGNHEYYKSAWPKLLIRVKEDAAGSNVHILENDCIKIGDVNFLGCTLWTDFNLFGNAQIAGYEASTSMNDYKKIRVSPQFRRLSASDTKQMHEKSLAWLKNHASRFVDDKLVIVTHHAPSMRSVPEHYQNDIVSAAYASNLDEVVFATQAKLWLHGHTHCAVDYVIGDTRVVCNPRGYPGEETDFNPDLVIEV